MESLSTDVFGILKILLPGFLSAWIFHGFTAYPKPSQFERVIQALIFTVFVQGFVFALKPTALWLGQFHSFGHWTNLTSTIWSYISAIALGFLFSFFANNDFFHALIRLIGVTKQTSYHCEWFGAFNSNITHVVLHLNDDRRVFGWPQEWPADPEKGQFILRNPSWIIDGEYVNMPTVQFIMFKAVDIKWVEFIQNSPEVIYVEKSSNSSTVQDSGT